MFAHVAIDRTSSALYNKLNLQKCKEIELIKIGDKINRKNFYYFYLKKILETLSLSLSLSHIFTYPRIIQILFDNILIRAKRAKAKAEY